MSREPFWLRHDLHVVGSALAMLLVAWFTKGDSAAAAWKTVAAGGVAVRVPASWLVEVAPDSATARGEDAVTRLELLAMEAPPIAVPIDAALELERAQLPLYTRGDTGSIAIGGTEWLRTSYSYAWKPSAHHVPRVVHAIELAGPKNGPRIYVATLHGPPERLQLLEPEILRAIRIEAAQ